MDPVSAIERLRNFVNSDSRPRPDPEFRKRCEPLQQFSIRAYQKALSSLTPGTAEYAELQAKLAERRANWSANLCVRQWKKVFAIGRNAIGPRLQTMLTEGTAQRTNRQKWRADLDTLDADETHRYDREVGN